MYPNLKVREQNQDGPFAVQDICSPVRECEDDSFQTIARIPKSYVPNTPMPTISVSTGLKSNSKKIEQDDDKPNIRASPIPRPRAVLSSPDNDWMIGSKNKTRPGKSSALKSHTVQSRHTQCKVVHAHGNAGSPLNTRKAKEVTDSEKNLKGK